MSFTFAPQIPMPRHAPLFMFLVLLFGLVSALLAVSGLVAGTRQERRQAAEAALAEGREEMSHGSA